MSELQQIFRSIEGMFEPVSGECEKHGKSTIRVRKDSGDTWACHKCFEEQEMAKTLQERAAKRLDDLRLMSKLPPKYLGQRFDVRSKRHRDARGVAKVFYDAVAARSGWRVLLLVGETGTGKTLLSCELGQRLIESAGMSVRYVTANQMLSEIKAAYSTEGKTEDGEVQRFVWYDLLILDEIDRMRGTNTDLLLIEEVVNRRYNEERPMIVISNKLREELKEYVGSRVSSRFYENGVVITFDWPDERRAGVA